MDAVEKRRIRAAQGGDEGAFRELVLEHRGQVTRLVYRMLGDRPDVEDVVQEVFVHVYRSIKRFRGDARFSTWLHRLSVNVVRMHLRKARSRPKLVLKDAPSALVETCDGPDEALGRRQRVEALYRLLDDLTEKKRTVLVLHDLQGMSPKQIAETLEIPVMTVRTRLFYARKELYARLACEPALAPLVEAMLEELPGRPGDGRP